MAIKPAYELTESVAKPVELGRCLILIWIGLVMGVARGWGAADSTLASTAQPTPESERLAAQLRVGRWIWTTNFADKQVCRLWRTFTLPATNGVRKANLRITADNVYHLYLDGREIGKVRTYIR